MLNTFAEIAWIKTFRERLKTLMGEDDDEQAFADTLVGETNIDRIGDMLLGQEQEAEKLSLAIGLRIKELKERQARVDERQEARRKMLLALLQAAGLPKLELTEKTVSIRKGGQSVFIHDDLEIPTAYWKTPDPVVDKKAITAALREGREVPGAQLVTGDDTLMIK